MKKQVTLTLCAGCIIEDEWDPNNLDRTFDTLEPGKCSCCGEQIVFTHDEIDLCSRCADWGWLICKYCGKAWTPELEEYCCKAREEEALKEEED